MSFTFSNTFACRAINDIMFNTDVLNAFERAIPEIEGKELEALSKLKGKVVDCRQDHDDLAIEMSDEVSASSLKATLSSFEDMGKIRIQHSGRAVYINTTRLHNRTADSVEALCLNNVMGKRLVKAMS